jgi:nucleotide-binding universal stress UspA family protein
MMSHTILVPHDGYEMSDKALKYAIEIAKGLNMNIKIIRVVEEVLDVSTMSPGITLNGRDSKGK